jgi:hypothetical protein
MLNLVSGCSLDEMLALVQIQIIARHNLDQSGMELLL